MDVLDEVRRQIQAEELSLSSAARAIGVTLGSLEKHLGGGYVRSDSLAKYRHWLSRGSRPAGSLRQNSLEVGVRAASQGRRPKPQPRLHEGTKPSHSPFRVVDLFSGCGGMSLGFELFQERSVFQTVLGLDVEEAMVKAFNDNCQTRGEAGHPICRKVDLTEFLNESEVRAFYLDHLASALSDRPLRNAMDTLPLRSISDFKSLVARTDADFLHQLDLLRAAPEFRKAYAQLGANTLGQTSVVGFHDALRLPSSSLRVSQLGPLVWVAGPGQALAALEDVPRDRRFRDLKMATRELLLRRWAFEQSQLRDKAKATARGQLESSARRIADFSRFLDCPAMQEVRELWLEWRATRDALREWMFADEETCRQLKSLYTADRQVAVLLGGPPCQGFSRIGRGKIRSLREHGVQVHVDPESGDERNKLLLKYVLFAAALAPKVFVFENVRHFQAKVKTPEGTYLATDVLEEALRELSRDALDYRVAMRIIDASAHLIPQTRERFFMVGVRSDVARETEAVKDIPGWCLTLERREPVQLRTALEGLPPPHFIRKAAEGGAELSLPVEVSFQPGPLRDAAGTYLRWVRQQPLSSNDSEALRVDGHHVRSPRRDDAEFFALMGPGTRWMDYRCDDSKTLKALREALLLARKAADAVRSSNARFAPGLRELAELGQEQFEQLESALDGSLSLRLLLENIEPRTGEIEHHLLTPGYLRKRNGNHGDWLARMTSEKPSKTVVSHMGKDTYAYVHPFEPRTLSVRETARIQAFPDSFRLGGLGLVDAFRVIGNAVPPLLSHQLADKVAQVLWMDLASHDGVRSKSRAAG